MGLVACPLWAWEADVHYGLTKWLAFEAGFSLDDAEMVAGGTEAPDEGNLYPAPSAVFIAACLEQDTDRSRLVQTYHFPSYGAVPGEPSARLVAPGSKQNAATSMVDKEIQTNLPNQPKSRTLEELGVALHPLQDSWSHQGEPDVPLPWICSRLLAFAHPRMRGGWLKHDADLTYLHEVPDVVETAHFTYIKLVAFLKSHPEMRSHSEQPWMQIEDRVKRFAKASSKSEKLAWFSAQSDVPLASYVTYPKFLDDTNLPATPFQGRSSVQTPEVYTARVQLAKSGTAAPAEAKEFVKHFLDTWIVEGSPERAATMVNSVDFARPFAGKEAFKEDRSSAVTRSILAMWLVQDHGLVNQLGHGFDERYGFDTSLRDLPRIKSENLRAALSGRGEGTYVMLPVKVDVGLSQPSDRAFTVVFQFRHAPRDAVILLISHNAQQGWKVSQLMWWAL